MKSQNDRILSHLKRRTLTHMQAVQLYGILCPTKRISELRQAGYDIETTMIEAGKTRVARWKLHDKPLRRSELARFTDFALAA